MTAKVKQLGLALRPRNTWGGKRKGAGRKPGPRGPGVPHLRRERVTRHRPVHVTMKVRPHVWNLRSRRAFRAIEAALHGVLPRADFRVVHFSVQGNHVHAVVEAEDGTALAGGMNAIAVRLARGLNRLMAAKGPVLRDRYHAHVLRTPAEVRHAIAYVLGNASSHARRGGWVAPPGDADPYSSAALGAQVVVRGRSWLLTAGVRVGE
jgi:REP element-mobilizing transposase RayT